MVRSDVGLGITVNSDITCGLRITPVDPAGPDCYRGGTKPC